MANALPAASLSQLDGPGQAGVAVIAQNWDSFLSGATVGGNFEDFREAARLGFVSFSPDDLATFFYYFTRPAGDNIAAGLTDFAGFAFARFAAQGQHGGANYPASEIPKVAEQSALAYMRNGASQADADAFIAAVNAYLPKALADNGITATVGSATAASGFVRHPVTGGYVPADQVKYDGPLLSRPGFMLFELVDGSRWEYAGPDYVPVPDPSVRIDTQAVYILGDDVGNGVRPVVSVKYFTMYANGSEVIGPWEPFAAFGTVAGLLAGYTGAPGGGTNPTVKARAVWLYRDLTPAVLAELATDGALRGLPSTTIPGTMPGSTSSPPLPIPPGPGDLLPPELDGPTPPPLDGGSSSSSSTGGGASTPAPAPIASPSGPGGAGGAPGAPPAGNPLPWIAVAVLAALAFFAWKGGR